MSLMKYTIEEKQNSIKKKKKVQKGYILSQRYTRNEKKNEMQK